MTHLDDPSELHLLYVLLDSNLPTGGFVSSSGLESFAKHGFLASNPQYEDITSGITGDRVGSGTMKRGAVDGVTAFAKAEIENYGMMTLGFVCDAWKVTNRYVNGTQGCYCGRGEGTEKDGDARDKEILLEDVMKDIIALDQYHETTSLSHVARRSSKAQGVAMLTLYVRGLYDATDETPRNIRSRHLIDEYKRLIRKGDTPGHLALCWGVVAAALGLNLDRATHLHLFLHARSLLSSAVRLNLIGPYISSQLLLHPFKPLINTPLLDAQITGILTCTCPTPARTLDVDPWAWAEEAETGPATTWPLGEVLMGRHDMQHSRIFNS